jgi:DNA-binding XRE family transcriptional regulator
MGLFMNNGYKEFLSFKRWFLEVRPGFTTEEANEELERAEKVFLKSGLTFDESFEGRAQFDREVAFGMLVKATRNILNMTQVSFAKEVGLSKPTIARLETFETNATIEMKDQICFFLSQRGIEVDMRSHNYDLSIKPEVMVSSYLQMLNAGNRRKDRK